jgi:hypothetical protein
MTEPAPAGHHAHDRLLQPCMSMLTGAAAAPAAAAAHSHSRV